jgi:alpha/beta superfamily hydrolase
MIEIRSSTVLPAIREPLTLTTSDGLRLVGELASPEDRPMVATLVCLHPLPTAGGMMDSHIQRKASWRLPALAGVGVLRFNTRGTTSPAGTSEGAFDAGEREGLDLLAALDVVASRGLPNVWLFGWSFGTDVALQHGLDPRVVGVILLSPPLRSTNDADLDRWAADGRPVIALVPELDDYLRPEEARRRFARIPQAKVIGVDGARHLWVGEPYVRKALDEVVRVVVGPEAVPLPTTWDGPFHTHQDLAPLV